MHMLARALWHMFVIARLKRRVDVRAITRAQFRVWPTDLDLIGHMNNGKYLSIMDVARFEYIARTGLHRVMAKRGWYPVVASQTITYRKSLELFQRFEIETRLIGVDDRNAFMEQRFVRTHDGVRDVYARAIVRARFLKRKGGPVPMHELLDAIGVKAESLTPPGEVVQWAESFRLPRARGTAESVWDPTDD